MRAHLSTIHHARSARRLLPAIMASLSWLMFCADSAAQPAATEPAGAGMQHAGHAAASPRCAGTELACANAASAAFDNDGQLWVTWTAAGTVSVARSTDKGASFGATTVIGRHGALLDGGSDAKPQIVVDLQGRIVVAYGVFKDKAWNAQVLVSTSNDGGISFTPPRSLSPDGASQRFPTLALRGDGALFAAWLDKRTVSAARKKGQSQTGAALATAWSDDGGLSFRSERIAQDHSCECCRLAVAFDPLQRPLVLYRAIFGASERDHALHRVTANGEPVPAVRIADDHWSIDGCPHHGPSLAVGGGGLVHAAWFTQGSERQGLFYARSTDSGQSFGRPQAVGDPSRQPGRPALVAQGDSVWLVWKEFDGKRIAIKQRLSRDGGLTWSADRAVAETAHQADHPQLVVGRDGVQLSWLTRDEGFRLMPLEQP